MAAAKLRAKMLGRGTMDFSHTRRKILQVLVSVSVLALKFRQYLKWFLFQLEIGKTRGRRVLYRPQDRDRYMEVDKDYLRWEAVRYMGLKRYQHCNPSVREWVIARWEDDMVSEDDMVYYRGQVVGNPVEGLYPILFPGFGYGWASWRNVFRFPSEIPPNSFLEMGLYNAIKEIIRRMDRGDTTAREVDVFDTMNRDVFILKRDITIDKNTDLKLRQEGGVVRERKSVEFHDVDRVEYIELENNTRRLPSVGDWVVARWDDQVYYRGMVLRKDEEGYYFIVFPGFGHGMVKWKEVYRFPSEINVKKNPVFEMSLLNDIMDLIHRRERGDFIGSDENHIYDTVNRDLMIEMDDDLKLSLSEQPGAPPDEGQPDGEVAYGGGGLVDFLFDNVYRQTCPENDNVDDVSEFEKVFQEAMEGSEDVEIENPETEKGAVEVPALLAGGDEVPSIGGSDEGYYEEAMRDDSEVKTIKEAEKQADSDGIGDEAMDVDSELAEKDEVISKHMQVIKLRLTESQKEFKSKHGFEALLEAYGGFKIEESASHFQSYYKRKEKAGRKGIES